MNGLNSSSHLLRQAALVQLQLGTDDDHRTAGVVDALAEQVLAEPALLALQRVAQRLQRTVVGAAQHAAAAAVVEQRVHGFLEHALSLRMMTSGALSSISFFNRLLRLMTRR